MNCLIEVLCFVMLLAAFGTLAVPKAMAQTVAVAEVTGYVADPTGGAVAWGLRHGCIHKPDIPYQGETWILVQSGRVQCLEPSRLEYPNNIHHQCAVWEDYYLRKSKNSSDWRQSDVLRRFLAIIAMKL